MVALSVIARSFLHCLGLTRRQAEFAPLRVRRDVGQLVIPIQLCCQEPKRRKGLVPAEGELPSGHARRRYVHLATFRDALARGHNSGGIVAAGGSCWLWLNRHSLGRGTHRAEQACSDQGHPLSK